MARDQKLSGCFGRLQRSLTNVITLTEGTPPTAAPYKLIYEYITRTMQQVGGYAQVSDIVDQTEFLRTGEDLTINSVKRRHFGATP